MKRLGLIGVGGWGRRYIDTVARRTDCRIVCFARARAGGGHGGDDLQLPGAERKSAWQELVTLGQRGELDGIVCATTPDNQAQVAAAAASAGVPCLVEKPLGLTAAEAAQPLRALQASSRHAPVVVNHIHLWSPAYRELARRARDSGSPVLTIESEGGGPGPFRGWSSLHDYGPHDLSMALALVGVEAPFSLQSVRREVPADPRGEVHLVRYRLGAAAVSMRVGNGFAVKARRFSVTLGGGDRLTYDDLQPHPGKLSAGETVIPVAAAMPLDEVLTDFLGLIGRFQTGTLDPAETAASLALARRVGAILQEIATAAPPTLSS